MHIKNLTSGNLSSHNVSYLMKQKVQSQGVHGLLSRTAGLGGFAFHFVLVTSWLQDGCHCFRC